MVPKPRMKPKFTIHLENKDEVVLERLDRILKSNRFSVNGQVLKKHAFVQLPREKRSFLSPYLNLSLVENEKGKTLVGRFSPHPHVWTGFMVVYATLAMIGIGGGVYGWAQALIGESAVMMWLFPISLAVIAFVYGAALIGQGLTSDEMYILRNVVDRAVEDCEKVATSAA
jgi:hypothetical protein